jgi:hypothetical protein
LHYKAREHCRGDSDVRFKIARHIKAVEKSCVVCAVAKFEKPTDRHKTRQDPRLTHFDPIYPRTRLHAARLYRPLNMGVLRLSAVADPFIQISWFQNKNALTRKRIYSLSWLDFKTSCKSGNLKILMRTLSFCGFLQHFCEAVSKARTRMKGRKT